MALEGKMIAEVPIQSDGDDLFHMLVGHRVHHAPTLAPHVVPEVNLLEGTTGHHGSTKIWTAVVDGKVETAKEKLTYLDEENKIVQLSAYEGDVTSEYLESAPTFQILKKTDGTTAVKITYNYKKKHAGVTDPKHYMDFFIALIKEVDAKLPKAN